MSLTRNSTAGTSSSMADTSKYPDSIQLLLQCSRCWDQYWVDAVLTKQIDHGDHVHSSFQIAPIDRQLAYEWFVSNHHEGSLVVQEWTSTAPLSLWQSLW